MSGRCGLERQLLDFELDHVLIMRHSVFDSFFQLLRNLSAVFLSPLLDRLSQAGFIRLRRA